MIAIKSSIILLILFILYKKIFKKFVTKHYNSHQKLTGDESIPLIGGLIFISYLIINYSSIGSLTIFFSFIIFLLGVLSDTNYLQSPKNRLVFQILLVILYIYFSNIQIVDLRSDFLNTILLNSYTKILFLTICFLVLINGSNFIDGLNGLNLGYFLMVFLTLWQLNFSSQIYLDEYKILLLIFPIIFLLILNLLNYLYLGDSGAYLLGFLVGVFLVEVSLLNSHISAYFIALLLWYPAFENFFSIFRKLIRKFDPVLPDTFHLHQLIFRYIKQKNFKLNKYSNQISSIIILCYNLLIFIISLDYYSKTNVLLFLITVNIFVYLIIYFLLKKYLN